MTLVADAHSTVANGILWAAQISAHHNYTLTNIGSDGPRAEATVAGDVSMEP